MQWIKFFGVVSVFLLSVNAYALTNDELACNDFLEKGEAAKALQQADKILKSNAQSTSALICRGRALNQQDQSKMAIEAFKHAEASTKDAYDQTVAIILRANTLKRLQKWTEAVAEYERAIKVGEKYRQLKLMAYTSIGDVHDSNNATDAALAAYQQAHTLSMNDNERGETASKMAAMYVKRKQYDLAVESQVKAYLMMEKSGTLDQYAQASVALGRDYYLNKNYEIAEKTLNKIITFAKERGGAYYEAQGSYVLALVKVAKNDKESAKKLVEYAKKLAMETKDQSLLDEIERETNTIF